MATAEITSAKNVGEPPPPCCKVETPDVLHPKQVAQPRKIYHYATNSTSSRREKSLLSRLFSGCCAPTRAQKARSFMIVAEQPPCCNNNVTTVPVVENVPTTKINSCTGTLKKDGGLSGSKLVLQERQGQAVIVETSNSCLPTVRKLQPKTNGILKQTTFFQKNTRHSSRGSNNFRCGDDAGGCKVEVVDTVARSRSRSGEKHCVTLRPPSPSSHSEVTSTTPAVGSRTCVVPGSLYSSSYQINNNQPQPQPQQVQPILRQSRRASASAALPTTTAKAIVRKFPVEIQEIDTTPPSLDPRVVTKTGEESEMVNATYYSSNQFRYTSTEVGGGKPRSQDRNIVRSSYAFTEPEPIVATATVTGARSSSNFARSRSVNYRHHATSANSYGPVGATLTPGATNTVTINVAGPPRTISTTKYSSSTSQHYRQNNSASQRRSPSCDGKVRVDVSPPRHQSSRRITYAPTPSRGRGETISVNAKPAAQYQTVPAYGRSKSPQASSGDIPSIPVGSKIDVTMRSRGGRLCDDAALKTGSSVRYTYETEFESECEECNYYRRLEQQKPPTACRHPQQQYSPRNRGPTKVQVGELVDEFGTIYHSVDNGPVRCRSPAVPVRKNIQDETPICNKTVVVTKHNKNNKRVLEALAATKKKLDQLDGDLDAALKRIQDRNNRLDAIPPPPRHETPKYAPPTAPRPFPSRQPAYIPITSQANDLTICTEVPNRRSGGGTFPPSFSQQQQPSPCQMGSNIVLITIADDGAEERFEENEQIIYSRSPPVREVMVRQPPRRVEIKPPPKQTPTPPVERPKSPGPDQFDYTDKKNVAVVSPHGTIGNIFHQLTHGKLPDFVHQRFNVEHSEEEIHNDDVDLCHADGTNVGRLEGFQNLDTIYELINMGIENAQAKVCFKVTCQRIEPVNPRAGVWKRKSVTASRVLNIDLSQNDELKSVLRDIQSAPGESVRMIMSTDVDSSSNVTTREKQLDTPTTAWAVAEILGKTIDQQGAAPISPRSVEGGPLKFLSPSKFAEEVYTSDILGNSGKELTAVPFTTRRGGSLSPTMSSRPWTTQPPPAYRPSTVPSR